MSTSKLPLEDISETVKPIDGDSALVVTDTKETKVAEDDASEPDWKITIENTDGSMSEVNFRQKKIRISMIADKSKQQDNAKPQDNAKEPDKTVSSVSEDEVTDDNLEVEKPDPSGKPIDPRWQRIWLIGQHTLTAASSIIIIVLMIVTLTTFHQNANVDGAFPKNPVLSPTIVMLSIACLNVAADLIMLGLHFWHGKTAATAGRILQIIRTVLSVVQTIGGVTSATYFKSAEGLAGGKDIWGFCCSAAATANFADMICSCNRTAWGFNILQIILHTLSFAMAIWTLFKPGRDLKLNLEDAKRLLGTISVNEKEEDDGAANK